LIVSVKKTFTQALSRATTSLSQDYDGVLRELMSLIESARRAAARAVNSVLGPVPPYTRRPGKPGQGSRQRKISNSFMPHQA